MKKLIANILSSIAKSVSANNLAAAKAATVKGDFEAALKLYKVEAAKGNAKAQMFLGIAHQFGTHNLPKDTREAARWYKLAAEQVDNASAAERGSSVLAAHNLGGLYEKGQGVLQDYQEAIRWYKFAAELGYGPAQIGLGRMYALGHGVLQNLVMAHMWMSLAAMDGEDAWLKTRDALADKMTPDQIAEAQRLAKEFLSREFQAI